MLVYLRIKNRIKTLKAEITAQKKRKNPNKDLIKILETFLVDYQTTLLNIEIEEENARVNILPKKGK
jgi:hypothetical protein